jgi:hypothetical protein
MIINKSPSLVTGLSTTLLAVLLGAASQVSASTNNLLVNGNFNNGLTGWGTWTAGGWVNAEVPGKLTGTSLNPPTWPSAWPEGAGTNYDANPITPLYDGSLQLTLGQGGAGSGSYANQTVAAAENVEYTLTVQGGADSWWLPYGEARMFFLDASDAVLSSSVVRTLDAIHNEYNGGLGDFYDVGVPYQNWTNIATSPIGTKKIKVELANPVGNGSTWFDNAVLTAPIDPPVISQVYPNGTRLLQATNTLSFKATSAAPINGSGVQVILNGVDVSGSLSISGSGTTNVTVSYPGLQTNQVYAAVINVTDTVNLSSFLNLNFDTYAPKFLWEAEDYDYNSGQFINSPVLSSTPTAGSYFGVSGVEGIDFHDRNGNGVHTYRSSDSMATALSSDTPRQNFVNASVADYIVGWFDPAGFGNGGNVGLYLYQSQEWVNYTRTFPAGIYNVYARITSGNGGTATVPVAKVTSGQGTDSQTTAALGAFRFPAIGWDAYAYVPLTDQFGNAVKVALTNTETLKVLAGTGANINFFLLVSAATNTPTITSVYPDGSTLVQGTNKLTFTVSSAAATIAQANVVVTLNGITNNSLTFSGSASSWNVSVPLNDNVTNYTAVIYVTDNAGGSHTTTVNFDTFNPASYVIEAENWDFNSGQYIDNPVITSNAAPDSYFNTLGTFGVDEHYGDVVTPPTADFHYRESDAIATSVCLDTPTRELRAAQQTNALAFNYNVGWWSTNGWLNYSHNYPAGNYHVYARLAGNWGDTLQIQLDRIGGTPSYQGTFTGTGRGFDAYDWVPLVNTNNGQLATVTLGGVATLRTTTLTGNVNPNSYLFVPVIPSAPVLNHSYSAGVLTLTWSGAGFHLQAQTNSLTTGLTGVWTDYAGGSTSPVQVNVDPTKGAVFFRLSN